MPLLKSRSFNRRKTPPNPIPFFIPNLFSSTPKAVSGTRLLTIVDLVTTWEGHFTNNGWGSIQDQIDAGFPIYSQPCPLTGSYEEVFDYGVAINSSIIGVNFSRADIVGDVDVLVKIATSLDNITYTAFETGSSTFAQTFRYVKVRLEFSEVVFASPWGNSLTVLTKLTVSASVKEQVDSGSIESNASDVSPGTEVLFNKAFKDVNSITATVESTTVPYEVVVSWIDVPNPASFNVMVFDLTGTRVTKQISWKARGII